MSDKVTLENLGGGSAVERFNYEMSKMFENIFDVNADPKQKRTVTLTVEMAPKKDREGVNVKYKINSKPASMETLETFFYLSRDARGKVIASEVNPKQASLEFSQQEIEVK